MAQPVQHHLGDRLLATHGLSGGLVVDRLGHAVQGAGVVIGGGLQDERAHGPDRQAGEGAQPVHHHRALAFLGVEADVRRPAQVEARPADGTAPAVGATQRRVVAARQRPDRGIKLGRSGGESLVGQA